MYKAEDKENAIRTVALETALGDGTAVWDGKDDAGQVVAPGVYAYRIEADGDGSETKSDWDWATVVKVEITSVVTHNPNNSFATFDAENDVQLVADIKPDSLDSEFNGQIQYRN